jgi:hypothetical protein
VGLGGFLVATVGALALDYVVGVVRQIDAQLCAHLCNGICWVTAPAHDKVTDSGMASSWPSIFMRSQLRPPGFGNVICLFLLESELTATCIISTSTNVKRNICYLCCLVIYLWIHWLFFVTMVVVGNPSDEVCKIQFGVIEASLEIYQKTTMSVGEVKVNYHGVISIILNLAYGPFESLPMVFAAQGLECHMWKIVSVRSWKQVNIIVTALKHQLCSHTTNEIYGQQKSWSCLYTCKNIKSGDAIIVQYRFFMISTRTMFNLLHDHLVEDAVLAPFGPCHQRWTTTPLSMIPRFNGKDPLRLSSVMVPQNLQLGLYQPRVHTPDRPSGEPPAGHQLL